MEIIPDDLRRLESQRNLLEVLMCDSVDLLDCYCQLARSYEIQERFDQYLLDNPDACRRLRERVLRCERPQA